MDYIKKRTHIINHPKFLKAGAVGRDLYDWGLLYSGAIESDGEIDSIAVETTAYGAGGRRNLTVAAELVGLGLWEKTPSGYRILRWAEQGNATKAQLATARREARDRMKKSRGGSGSSSPPASPIPSPPLDPVPAPLSQPSDVRANFGRSAPEVPSSTFNSSCDLDLGSGSPSPASKSSIRAREPDPEPGEGPWPAWFDGVLATLATQVEPIADPAAAWVRYEGHRASKGEPMSGPHARYWLTTVVIAEQRKARHDERIRLEREELRNAPPPPPAYVKPTAEQSRRFARELAERTARIAKQVGGAP